MHRSFHEKAVEWEDKQFRRYEERDIEIPDENCPEDFIPPDDCDVCPARMECPYFQGER